MTDGPALRPRHLRARKLLGVSLGVATVSLIGSACACTTGNLVAPPPDANFLDAGTRPDAPDERDAPTPTDAETDGAARKP
jgi:hypothetical protein